MGVPYTKDKLLDTMGRPLTQSLFLELGYNTDYALFTLNDDDKLYQGKTYYSLKKLYLEIGDPSEYEFAKACLLGWRHWKRLQENKLIRPHIEEWREEIEVMRRSEGILSIADQAEGNFQAAKWLAERGWDKRGAGRPSKVEKKREEMMKERISENVFSDNILRMEKFDKVNNG